MTPLQLEELVSYFFYAHPAGENSLHRMDFYRLIERIGLEGANRFRGLIARQIAEGHHLYLIQATLAA